MHKRKIAIILICIISMGICTACRKEEKQGKEKTKVEYTVMSPDEIPDKFMEEISKKKNSNFQMTYRDGEYMYIAVGYGEQETGGYSISVNELYLTNNAIYINSSLIGPRENDLVLKAKTYPYVVVKTENRDINVVFDS